MTLVHGHMHSTCVSCTPKPHAHVHTPDTHGHITCMYTYMSYHMYIHGHTIHVTCYVHTHITPFHSTHKHVHTDILCVCMYIHTMPYCTHLNVLPNTCTHHGHHLQTHHACIHRHKTFTQTRIPLPMCPRPCLCPQAHWKVP